MFKDLLDESPEDPRWNTFNKFSRSHSLLCDSVKKLIDETNV